MSAETFCYGSLGEWPGYLGETSLARVAPSLIAAARIQCNGRRVVTAALLWYLEIVGACFQRYAAWDDGRFQIPKLRCRLHGRVTGSRSVAAARLLLQATRAF